MISAAGRDGDIATHVSASLADGAVWFNAIDYYVQQQGKGYATAADPNYNPFKHDTGWDAFPESGMSGGTIAT